MADKQLQTDTDVEEELSGFNVQVLRWGRERYAISIERAAKLCSLSQDRFADFEEGRAYPTYTELRRISNGIRLPKAVFFFPEPPAAVDHPDFMQVLENCSGYGALLFSAMTANSGELKPDLVDFLVCLRTELLRLFNQAFGFQEDLKRVQQACCSSNHSAFLSKELRSDSKVEMPGVDHELTSLREQLYFDHAGVFMVDFAADSFCSPEMAEKTGTKVSALLLADLTENQCEDSFEECKFPVVLLNSRCSDEELYAALQIMLPCIEDADAESYNRSQLCPARTADAGRAERNTKDLSLRQRLELMLGRPYVIDVLGLLAEGELDEEEAASLLHCHIDELPEL